jgi:uncharacterized membrane protein
MTIPTSEPLPPEDFRSMPPARRRRRKRMIVPGDSGERSEYLDRLAHRVLPSFEFYLLSIIAGLTLGIAILLDYPALYFLAAILSPFMAPVMGLALASVFGSGRFFVQTVGGMLIGSLIVFANGALAGYIAHFFPALTFNQAIFHTHFTWVDFSVLTVGAILTPILLARSEGKFHHALSVALAYEIFLPIGVAGFGLTSGQALLWPDGVIVFVVHFAWAALIGTAVFALIGLRPTTFFGYTIGTSLLLVSLAGAAAISGVSTAMSTRLALPTNTPSPTITLTPSLTVTLTPVPPTLTSTPTRTLVPTRTPTLTVSPEPTPIYARINAPAEERGAVIRSEPSTLASIVQSLLNGMLVEIIPDQQQVIEGTTWVRVRTAEGIEGWVMLSLLKTGP